jgi:predicted lipoprotein with Yx(FWY)xxD motif
MAVGISVAALIFTACGSNTTQTSGSGGSAGSATVDTAKVSSVGTVLVDAQGLTLYHLTTENGSNIVCTGSCASTWPPLSVSGRPTAGSGVTGQLGTTKRPDGSLQATYMGMTLYTYSGDSGPGQGNGQGVDGIWFAVGPNGLANGTSAGSGSGSGYGYGG